MIRRLSVLDDSPAGSPLDSVGLAKEVDHLGFTRYWLADHRGILAATLLGSTENLRIGTGALAPRPATVAESFRVLSGLFPDRVDLVVNHVWSPAGDTTIFRVVSGSLRRTVVGVNAIAAETAARAMLLGSHSRRSSLIVGPVERVRAALVAVAAAHQVDELIVNTPVRDPDDRLRSCRLLADAFGLRSADRRAAA